jgi:hypothetical protein
VFRLELFETPADLGAKWEAFAPQRNGQAPGAKAESRYMYRHTFPATIFLTSAGLDTTGEAVWQGPHDRVMLRRWATLYNFESKSKS